MGNEAVDIREKELRRKFRTIRKELGKEGIIDAHDLPARLVVTEERIIRV